MRHTFIALGCALAVTGCSGLAVLEGGYARSVSTSRNAVQVNAHAGFGSELTAGGNGSGAGFQLRTKFGTDLAQVGVGPHFYLLTAGQFLGLSKGWASAGFLRAGVDLLQLGAIDGHGNVGIFSPYADLGWLVMNPGISLSVGAHYDVRLSSAKNDLWLGAAIGFGFAPTTKT